jgi:hypothetical protein
VIVFGVVMLLLYYLILPVYIIYVIGLIAVVLGAILLLLSFLGHPVGGRRYWY